MTIRLNSLLMGIIYSFIVSCANTGAHNTSELNERNKAFEETLETFKPSNSEQGQLLNTLKLYRKGYSNSNWDNLSSTLSEDFKIHYFERQMNLRSKLRDSQQKINYHVNNKEDYSRRKIQWKSGNIRNEQLIIDVVKIEHHSGRNFATIATKTTYKSRYFNPRFHEVFHFVKDKFRRLENQRDICDKI